MQPALDVNIFRFFLRVHVSEEVLEHVAGEIVSAIVDVAAEIRVVVGRMVIWDIIAEKIRGRMVSRKTIRKSGRRTTGGAAVVVTAIIVDTRAACARSVVEAPNVPSRSVEDGFYLLLVDEYLCWH